MRTVLITGATDGLGLELARRLAAAGDRVIVHGRDPERVRQARESAGGTTEAVLADLAELRQVDRLADEVNGRVDVLVNNAGVGGGAPGTGREESKDGIELRFAVNYLAGYHLARRLAPPRVVNVASVGQQAIDFDDPMITTGYGRQRAYSQSKLAQIMFTFDLMEDEVSAAALHPATYMDTTMVRQAGAPVLSTVAEGAEATLRLINGSAVGYFNGQVASRADAQAYDLQARARLRALSEELIAKALS